MDEARTAGVPDEPGTDGTARSGVSRRSMLQAGLAGAAGVAAAWLADPRTDKAAGAATNPIVAENALPGTAAWRLTLTPSDDTAKQVQGYASATSVNLGETISFYVTVNPAQTFSLDVYRVGHYQGLGARLMLHDSVSGASQPNCVLDPSTGLITCPWSASYQLTVPSDWTTGVYLVKLTNSNQYQSYITFVVRDDASTSALLYQQAVTTYQAYNNYPNDVPAGATLPQTGKSNYDYNSSASPTGVGTTRAAKVSFDRPYSNNNGAGDFLDWELFFVRFLERNGYDVSYCTDLDTHVAPQRLLRHRGFLSVGHDEYWTLAMYDGLRAALDGGVGVGFFGANALYCQIRLEPNAAGAPNRVQVCYKDATKDPVSGPTTTVLWRSSTLNRPEQQLLGSMFVGQQPNGAAAAAHVVANSGHWAYAGTGVADGDSIPGIIGYECDRANASFAGPTAAAGTFAQLSDSPFVSTINANERSAATVYQAASGAWVFNAGSIQWSWGLENIGNRSLADARVQRMTANVLDRIAAGPAAIPAAPSGLTATPTDARTIALSWTDNANNATGFVLERSTSPTFATVTCTSLPAGTTSRTDSAPAAGVYFYRVRATNGNGASPQSATAGAATLAYADLVRGRSALRSQWRLDETSGATAADGKGTADGTYLNGVGLNASGAIARDPAPAAQFNGSTHKVSLPTLPAVGDFSIVGWSFLTAANANNALFGTFGAARILVRPGGGPSAYGGVWLNGTEYYVQPSLQASNLNVWTHWALTRAGATLCLYRNGILLASRSDLPAGASADISGWIGAQGGSAYYFPGRIDQVATYTAALSADDVAADYQAGTNGLAPTPVAQSAYRDLVLGDAGLLGYWRLGESAGTVAVDAKSAANGTYYGTPALRAPGAIVNDPDTAVAFNGSTHKIALPALAAVGDFSIEAWTLLASGAAANSNGNNAVYGANNQVRLLARPGGSATSTDMLAGVWLGGTEYTVQPTSTQTNIGAWVHWVLVRKGNVLTLYRNGAQAGQRTDLPASATANVSGWIGAQGGSAYYLNGRIDEVAVYGTALRASVVSAHYAAGLTGPTPR